MKRQGKHHVGIRSALRRFLSHTLGWQPPPANAIPSVANLAWDETDFRLPPVNEDNISDPWDADAPVSSAAPSSAEPKEALEHSQSTPAETPCERGSRVESYEAPPDAEPLNDRDLADQKAPQKGQAADFSDEAADSEYWSAINEAENNLVDVRREIHEFENDLRGADHSDEKPLSDTDEEAIERLPADWHEIRDAPLDAEWTEDSDWHDGFDVQTFERDTSAPLDEERLFFDFDETARRNPWDSESSDEEVILRRARAKAATVASLLDTKTITEQSVAFDYLLQLFKILSHASTFRALRNLTTNGLDLETLQAMMDLRSLWTQRPELWLHRYGGGVDYLKHGGAALTWMLAHQVCLARAEYPTEAMIDEEWLDEWLTLPPGAPGYLSFPAFMAEKVNNEHPEAVYVGFRLSEQYDDCRDDADSYGWHRQLPAQVEILREGFRILTPYDERPGLIGRSHRAKNREVET